MEFFRSDVLVRKFGQIGLKPLTKAPKRKLVLLVDKHFVASFIANFFDQNKSRVKQLFCFEFLLGAFFLTVECGLSGGC